MTTSSFVAAASLSATIPGSSRDHARRDGVLQSLRHVHAKKLSDLARDDRGLSIPFCFFTLGQLVSWLIQVQVLLRFIWQCAAVVLLRRYRSDIPQPFTMWLYPWPAILSGALWLFIFFTGPWEGIIFSVAFLLAGVAAYGVFARMRARAVVGRTL
jgi:hypothetical protein